MENRVLGFANGANIGKINQYVERFSQFLGNTLGRSYFLTPQNYIFHIQLSNFSQAVSWLSHHPSHPALWVTMTAVDSRRDTGTFQLYTVFMIQELKLLMTLVVELASEMPVYEAITPTVPAAEWAEREIHDLFGIVPKGMALDPLVLHRDWPRGKHYPFLHDFQEQEIPPSSEVPHQFNLPDGEGIHQVAVGPIHAGIIEPGHLRFTVTGEKIHQFDAQLFYTHKGIEKMAEGKHYNDVLNLAEHVCGMCAFSHSVAFCQSVEALGRMEIPIRALQIRTICLELERLASHMADLTAIASAGGFAVASQRAAFLREKLMQNNEQLTGHRFLRGLNVVGGLNRDIPNECFEQALELLAFVHAEFRQWVTLILSSDSFLDRLETTGKLTYDQAKTLGIVGPAARASGINRDVRRDFPYGLYHQIAIHPPHYSGGDALARTKVRIDEMNHSFSSLTELIRALIKNDSPRGVCSCEETELPAFVPSASLVESPKGELVHWVILGPDNEVRRWHVRSASYMNWRGMVQATMGENIVPDGPLVNKSFNLCYACVDR